MTAPGGAFPIVRALTPAQVQARLEALQLAVALTSASTLYVLDSVLVDNYQTAEWKVVLTKTSANGSQRTVSARHNGSSGADATTVDYGDSGPDDVGTVDVAIACDVSGAGTAQVMRLTATPSSTGWTASVWRLPTKSPQP